MHQIKLFRGVENDLATVEKQVNKWLQESGARVISIRGNIAPQSPPPDEKLGAIGGSPWAPSDVLLIIHYEK